MAGANLGRALTGSHWVPGVAVVSIIVFLGLQCLDVSVNSFSHASNEPHRKRHASTIPALSFKNILFAHVGKAGGNTIRVLFKGFCESEKKRLPEECDRVPESELADRVTGYLHDWNFYGEPEEADAFLYNLRHPVDRMISWYYYEHPDSCMNDHQTDRACETAQDIEDYPDGRADRFYRQCFPTQDYLPLIALAVNHTNSTTLSQSCSKLARKVVKGKIFERGFKHMYYNMRHYTTETIDEYPDKGVLVVRTEFLWDDIKDIDMMLGGKGTFGEIEGSRDSHGSEQYKRSNKTLSVADYGSLCCALMQEMDIYRRLVELAVNLDEDATKATIASTAQKCGFSSWDAMMAHCTS